MKNAHKNLYAEIGKRIKEQRLQLGLTQEELAEKLDISRASLANIEVGRQSILIGILYDIARELHCSPGDLAPKPRLSSRDVIWLRNKESKQVIR